jgi:hypothetical protein
MRPLRPSTDARRYHHFASEPCIEVATAYASRAAPTIPLASQIMPKRPHRTASRGSCARLLSASRAAAATSGAIAPRLSTCGSDGPDARPTMNHASAASASVVQGIATRSRATDLWAALEPAFGRLAWAGRRAERNLESGIWNFEFRINSELGIQNASTHSKLPIPTP